MKIEINGEPKEVDNAIDLNSLVNNVVSDTQGLAVALNNTVVPKNNWDKTTLNESDKILLIRATQGG